MKKRDLRNDWALFFYITAYIKPYLGILFLATVALAGNLVLLLLRPYLTKQVIDLGFATNDIAVIEYYALMYGFTIIGSVLFIFVENYFLKSFGQKIILENGELNRPLLASLIFSNPEEREWSKQIQGEIIREELATLRDQLAQTEEIFFMDIPLLFEQAYSAWFDETWLVYVDRDVQVERLMKRNQLSKDEAEFRLAAQWPLEKKKDLASQILDNNGNQNQLLNQVHILLEVGRQDDRD